LFQYTIRPGDTLFSISARFGVPINAILAANPGLSPYNLVLGQVILIPATNSFPRVPFIPVPVPFPGRPFFPRPRRRPGPLPPIFGGPGRPGRPGGPGGPGGPGRPGGPRRS